MRMTALDRKDLRYVCDACGATGTLPELWDQECEAERASLGAAMTPARPPSMPSPKIEP